MRLSCNGCRVLRKGCSESCSIRPCLQWIKSSDAQSNATVFLAKFYGRAGLLNLVNAAPEHLRPAVFRSLLYEACGRIVNPVYGSVGLLWSGNWTMCQAAVEAVLKGAPIVQIADSDQQAAATSAPPVAVAQQQLDKAAYDIRHVSASPSPPSKNKKQQQQPSSAPAKEKEAPSAERRLTKKRTSPCSAAPAFAAAATTNTSNCSNKKPRQQQPETSSSSQPQSQDQQPASSMEDSDEAAASHVSQAEAEAEADADEHSTHNQAEAEQQQEQEQQLMMGLDLTLGFAPVPHSRAAGDAACNSLTAPPDVGLGWTAGEPAFRFL